MNIVSMLYGAHSIFARSACHCVVALILIDVPVPSCCRLPAVDAMMLPTAAAHAVGRCPITFTWRHDTHSRSTITARISCRPCRQPKPFARVALPAHRRIVAAAAAAKKTPSIEELAARDQLLDLLLQAKSQEEVHRLNGCVSPDMKLIPGR